MRRPSRSSTRPYVIMGAMRISGGGGPPWVVGQRARRDVALEWCRDMTFAWLRLVGVHAPVLIWWVRDMRDGTDHYLPSDRRRITDNDDQTQGTTTLF